MTKKAIKYFIILLLVPLILSVIIAIYTGVDSSNDNDGYNSIDGSFEHDNKYTYEEKVKRSNTFIYLSVFSFVMIGVGVWIYVRKKENS